MMNKTTKEQKNALVVRIAGVTILLILLMVSILYGTVSQVGAVSQVETVSYIEQLESLAGIKGYTTEDKVTYNERLHLETEEGRYKEVMNYLEDTEVSESEFQEIKEIQSKYEQSLKQVNESGKRDYSFIYLVSIVFGVLTIIGIGVLIPTVIGAY